MSRSRYLASLCLITLPVLLAVAPARAALDPEKDKPYQFRVILHFGNHPVLTPTFKDRLRHGLHNGFQDALGKMGQVQVVDRDALLRVQGDARDMEQRASIDRALSLLKEVEEHGLQKVLDNWKEVSESKTHFVLVDFVNGQYVIQARQFDGLTGLASPLVRESRTSDREFVPRIASYLIRQDFGLVGTLEPSFPLDKDNPEVNLMLKGGALGQPFGPWLQAGEVFAVSQIQRTSGGLRAYRMRDLLLQVKEEPRDGTCRCRVLHRYENPLPSQPPVVGYRCLKLGTTTAKLQLRLVDDEGAPIPNQHYMVSQDRFEPSSSVNATTNADGLTRPQMGPYRHVARVRVLTQANNKIIAEFPVEILDGRLVVRNVRLNPEAEKLGQFEFEKKHLINRLDESLLASSGLVEELNQLSKDREKALEKAAAGLLALKNDLATYNGELVKLRQTLDVKSLAPVEDRMQQLQQKQTQFEGYLAQLKKVIAEERDPLRAELSEMAGRAQLLESTAEFDQAIALYEKIVQKGGNQEGFQRYARHLEELKKDWTPKSEEHRQARAFIYGTWPMLKSAADLQAHVAEAKKALQICSAAGDKRTPLKLLKSNTAHANNLAKRLEEILKSTNEEDKKEGKTIVDVQQELAKLTADATSFVQKGPPAGK